MKTPTLEPPHAFLAAAELLADLRSRPELAPYVMPEVWRKPGQHAAISALAQSTGAAVAVGIGEVSLPAAGQKKQGGQVRVGVAVYVFQPEQGTFTEGSHPELLHSLWLTVLRTVNTYRYTLPNGTTEKALIAACGEVDLSAANSHFAQKLTAEALMIDIPLCLNMPELNTDSPQ